MLPHRMTSSRKQREIQEREQLILQVAGDMLLERGYLGLTMDRIAVATEYSKGTIYQHFNCKEDLLAHILLGSCRQRLNMFERAATFRGNSRERIAAIGIADELMITRNPQHQATQQVVQTASIREKCSTATQDAIRSTESRVMAIVFGIVRDAIAHGDLTLPTGYPVEDVVLGLWSMHQGTHEIMQLQMPLEDMGFSPPLEAMRRNTHIFLDGLGWRPSASEFDYPASRERALTEIFAAECQA